MKARTVSATHEHEWEAAPGLPSTLPDGEAIVWQGTPDWKQLAVHAFHVRKIAIYFATPLEALANSAARLAAPSIVSTC